MGDKILFKRGLVANIPSLDDGEPGWCTDTNDLYIGDGGTNRLVGGSSSMVGALLTDNTVLKADTASTPAALTVAEQRVVGRVTGGVITDLTGAQVRTVIDADYGEVDALIVYGGGTSYTKATIDSALTGIGLVNKTTLVLRAGTWVIGAAADWSAYTNVTFRLLPGAVLSHSTYTMTIPNLQAGQYQIFSGTGAITLTGYLKSILPEWYGAIGDGTTNCVAAMNGAIATANAIGGNVTIRLSDGLYYVPTALDEITVSGVWVVGNGANASRFSCAAGGVIQFGDSTSSLIVEGGVRGLGFYYASAPDATAICIRFEYATRINVSDISLTNVRIFAWLGYSAARYASAISFRNIFGYVYNGGSPCFSVRYGAGLFIKDATIYVGGVSAPTHPDNMTTASGTDFIQASTGTWDTFILSDILAERWYRGIYAYAASSVVINNLWMNNCVFDYNRENGLLAWAASGGIVVSFHVTNCWFVAWEGIGVYHSGPGRNSEHQYSNCKVLLTGSHGMCFDSASATACLNFTVEGCIVYGNDRKGDGGRAAIIITEGSSGFIVKGNRCGLDGTALGVAYQADYGLSLGASCLNYSVDGNVMEGAVSGYDIPATCVPHLGGVVTWNPGSLDDAVGETSAGITVTGAALGDTVVVGAGNDAQDMTVSGYVQAADTVEIRLQNESGGTKNLDSSVWRVKVFK